MVGGERGKPRGGIAPIPLIAIIPIRELTEGLRGCSTGPRGGDSGKDPEGEGEIRGEGRKKPALSACCCWSCCSCCCCCCCWCMRAMATLLVAAAVCSGAWTRGAQITGRGLGDTLPLPPITPLRPAAAAAMASCIAGMLSCLTICCTRMLSDDPSPPAANPPDGPPPRPPPRPILPPSEPPWDDLRRSIEFFLPMRSRRSTATVSKARLIIGCSSSTSLKLSTLREYRRQYVSARTLAVLLPRVNKQISPKYDPSLSLVSLFPRVKTLTRPC